MAGQGMSGLLLLIKWEILLGKTKGRDIPDFPFFERKGDVGTLNPLNFEN